MARLCSDLQTLVQERAEIEKTYAKSLKAWSKKWTELIEKGPEYGTMEAAWKSSLIEADRISDVHIHMKENLYNDVIFQIKAWQKDNYHKVSEKLIYGLYIHNMYIIVYLDDDTHEGKKRNGGCI